MSSTLKKFIALGLAVFTFETLEPSKAQSESTLKVQISGATRMGILELYTSEGCSSCPPAEECLASLVGQELLSNVAPLAFHVDYWDYLGWKDDFGKKQFAERQHAIANREQARNVYTPQFVWNGRSSRWGAELLKNIKALGQEKPQAQIQVFYSSEPHWKVSKIQAALESPSSYRQERLFAVFFENGIVQDVSSGENSGRKLSHDFVVRKFLGPFPFNAHGLCVIEEDFLPEEGQNPSRSGFVCFVQNENTGQISQTIALYPLQ